MRKFLLSLAILFSAPIAFSQQQEGLFIDKNPDTFSKNGKYAIETLDGCFILSETYPSSEFPGLTEAMLMKISSDGELLATASLDSKLEIAGLYGDPDDAHLFHAICLRGDDSTPCIVSFDDGLNNINHNYVELPEGYTNGSTTYCGFWRSMLGHDNKLVLAVTTIIPMPGPGPDCHRYYLLLAFDGTIEQHSIEYRTPMEIGCPFMHPDGSRWCYNMGVLSRFDDSLRLEQVQRFSILHEEPTETGMYFISISYAICPTAVALPDSSMLFAEEADENWHDHSGYPSGHNYFQVAFFKRKTDGSIQKYILEGTRDIYNQIPYFQAIDYVDPDTIYLCGYQSRENSSTGPLVMGNTIFLKKVNGDLDIIWEKSLVLGVEHYEPRYMFAARDGGCMIVGRVFYDIYEDEADLFACKVNPDGTLGTKEIIGAGHRPYTFAPNPVKDRLYMEFSPDVQPVQIELNDLQGRLVGTQRNGLGNVDMSRLPAGAYMMRVTLEDGKTFADKVVKE